MRYGIFSDVHSNLEALEAVIAAYRKENIDRYLCVGDIVGYGANPKECISRVKTLAVLTIAGNHDLACVDLFPTDYFNEDARQAVIWTKLNIEAEEKHFLKALKLIYKNKSLALAHGTLHEPQEFHYLLDAFSAQLSFNLLESGICFVGHSHVAGIFIQDKDGNLTYSLSHELELKKSNKYIANVGSVGQPRDGDPRAAYCVYDTEEKMLKIKRIGYDVKLARKKIIANALPRFLGDRLLSGK